MGCSFGRCCSSGGYCLFGRRCSFGKRCSFSEGCSFGKWCSFGKCCLFGERCSFDERCSFGEDCSFGEYCSFENERVNNGIFFAVDRIGSGKRKAYFFVDEKGNFFVRAGCFFGTEKEFILKLLKTHHGSKYERHYLLALDLAKDILGGLIEE